MGTKERRLREKNERIKAIQDAAKTVFFAKGFRPLQSYIKSLERIEDLKVTGVYPAHGVPFGDLKGRAEEIKEHHRRRKESALNALTRFPKTAS
jgi:glyoxylase-like metal-dependent hydrolase (beta-lactamase superfamily II)